MTASDTTEFTNVHALISQVLMDSTDVADIRRIAEVVAQRIPEDLRMQMLINALMPQVKNVMRAQRNTALSNVMEPRPEPRPRPAPVFHHHGQPAPIGTPTSIQAERLAEPAQPKRPRSAKVEGIRDWWSEMLAARVHVGEKRWVPLGDCGVAELEFAETERRNHAEREIKHAKMYLRLRELLDQFKVATVSELPAEAARKAAA